MNLTLTKLKQLIKEEMMNETQKALGIPHGVDLKDNPHAIAIEIREDNATMFVNGEKVFSAYFDLAEIDRSGKIGLLKKWFDPEVTFSNLQIRSLNDN